VQAGWQAKLNSLGNTIFWGQYVDVSAGLNAANGAVSTIAAADVLNSIGAMAIQRSASTQTWGLGVSQNIDAAAMTLYAGFHNVQTELTLGSTTSTTIRKANAIDDMQIFYTGATIKF